MVGLWDSQRSGMDAFAIVHFKDAETCKLKPEPHVPTGLSVSSIRHSTLGGGGRVR